MRSFHLYNRTQLPTALMRKLIFKAMKRAECGYNITVYLTPSHYQLRGEAYSCGWTRPGGFGFKKQPAHVMTDSGYCQIWIPSDIPHWRSDMTKFALDIYDLLVHELKHVADFQYHRPFDSHKKHWRNRIHERRAVITATLARKAAERCDDDKLTEYITDLALVLEEQRQAIQPVLQAACNENTKQEDK